MILVETRGGESLFRLRAESFIGSLARRLLDDDNIERFGCCYTGFASDIISIWPEIEVYADEVAKQVWSHAQEYGLDLSDVYTRLWVPKHLFLSFDETLIHELIHHIGDIDYNEFPEHLVLDLARSLVKQCYPNYLEHESEVPVLEVSS